MNITKATKFKFDKSIWRTSTVCDENGMCCVIGQYLLACGYTKIKLMADAFSNKQGVCPYKTFRNLTGISPPDIYYLNDDYSKSLDEKIGLLQEKFAKAGIEMISE